jgi:hypothetical protein
MFRYQQPSTFNKSTNIPMTSLLPNSAHYDLACQLQACQSKSHRNGKVARLPIVLREQINHMLDDGLPYKDIIEKLGPPGQHLNEDNLSNWRLGGYQDFLKTQAINDLAQVQTQAAAEVLRDTGLADAPQLQQVCTQIALLQYMQTLVHHGDELARLSIQKNPAKMITLINALCNLSNLERRHWPPRNADCQSAVSPIANRQVSIPATRSFSDQTPAEHNATD